jgi:P-type E1-E2 ATPase
LVGDILPVREGDMLPGDCILLEATNIACDEANLTGEPENKRKEPLSDDNALDNPDSYLLQSTTVV